MSSNSTPSGLKKFENGFIRVAGKISGNRLLLTLRDTFVLVAATTMIAGFGIMIQNVIVDPMNGLIFGKQGLQLGRLISGSWAAWQQSGFEHGLQTVANLIALVSNGTLNIFALLLVVIFSWEVSTRFFSDRAEHMTDVLFGLAAFFISIPWNFQYAIPNTKKTINVLNYIDTQYLGTQGVFAAILISGCAVWLYNKLMQRNFTIKLPDSVPPAVAQSFSSLIPGSITLGVFIILTGLSTACTGKTMPALFLSFLQAPALAISKTNAFAFVSQFTWSLLQWFGIHPTSIWGAIFGMTWTINDTQNMLGQAHHIFSTLFMNFSTIAAGTFSLSPVLAILIASKRVAARKITKVALLPAIFNISEPITFGLPIVLNPIYFIPFVIAQPLSFYIGYFFTKIGFIAPIVNNVPWTVPTLLSGLLYTGNIRGVIVQAVCLAVTTLLYIPFVRMDNKINADQIAMDEMDKANS